MIDLSAGRNVVNIDADSLRARRRRIFAAIGRNGMYPLDAPGMPPPGPDFLAHARALGDSTVFKKQSGKKADDATVFQPGERLEKLYLRALREPGFTMPIEVRKGQEGKAATFIPGHIWGQHMASYHASLTELGAVAVPVDGPQPADVMIIGKMPWDTELAALRNFVGPTGDKLYECLQQARVEAVENFYITNLIKFMPPDGSSTIKANWLADCLPLLHQELRIVRPRFILFLGADATKALLGSGVGVTNMQGRVVPFTYPVHLSKTDEPETHTAHCMTVTHPAQVTRDVTLERGLVQGLSRFKLLLNGAQFKDSEDNIDHRTFSVLEDALDYLQECSFILKQRVAAGLPRWVSWDAEWHGQQPINDGSYLRTVQISVAPFTAGTFMLRDEDGKRCFVDRHGKRAEDRLVKALNQFMQDKWAVGHFLVADLAWLEASGIHLLERFEVPLHGRGGKQAWELLMDGTGGFDTGMAAHSLEETAVLGLDTLCMRYTEVPPYWVKLEEWIVQYCKEQGIPRRALEGYGMVPDAVLLPYANYDADATLRLALKLRDYLSDDYNHNNCWESFWEKMAIQPVWLEMSQHGVCVDRQRIDRLTFMFLAAREKIEAHITKINAWPKFNIRSVQHVKEFLFGHELNGKVTDDGKPLRLRPEGAVSLRVEPLLTTSKPPKRWSDIVEQNKQADFSPSTGKMVLAILAQDHLKTTYRMPDGTIGNVGDRIQEIRNYRKVDQVLKGFLRPPEIGEDGLYIVGDDGEYSYESGLAFCVDKDGRVRTHFGLAETGRWRSFRPNMQNWCVDASTEFLTRHGWVRADSLSPHTKLAQYWPDTKAIDFVKPTALFVNHHIGHMCHIRTQEHIDMLVTPNHRCLLRSRKSDQWLEVPAEDFRHDHHHINAGNYWGGVTHLSSAWVIWLSAMITSGHYDADSLAVSFVLREPRKFSRLTTALNFLGVTYVVQREAHHSISDIPIRVEQTGNDAFLQKTRSILGPNRCLGPWLLDCDRISLDMFAEEFFFWGGSWSSKKQFTSTNKANADWVQILWILSGMRARLQPRSQPKSPDSVSYVVDSPIRDCDYSLTTNFTMEKVPWNDKVYCVSVPSEFIVIRRNGKVAITGNSKTADKDLAGIVGKDIYKEKLRSILRCGWPDSVAIGLRRGKLKWSQLDELALQADPQECWVGIECDYIGAELYGMAIMAGDDAMIEHCQRNQLKESDPLFYDIHSSVAVLAFRLTVNSNVHKSHGKSCSDVLGLPVGTKLPATKTALECAGFEHLRTIAKTVIFGIAYGRGAKAIALAAKEQGINISVEDAQAVIDTIFRMYPRLQSFFEQARKLALEKGWLCHCYGGLRRFPHTNDFVLAGEFERQAMNFPIQGMIASALNRGVACLRATLRQRNIQHDVRILLAIHDALVVECRPYLVDYLARKGGLLEWAMCKQTPIYPTDLAGKPTGKGPYFLGLDVSVFEHWSEKIPNERCKYLGIPEGYGEKPKIVAAV